MRYTVYSLSGNRIEITSREHVEEALEVLQEVKNKNPTSELAIYDQREDIVYRHGTKEFDLWAGY